MKKLKTVILFTFFILACSVATAAPTLTNVTPTWQHAEFNESKEFSFFTPLGITGAHWYINGVETNYTGFNLSYTFDEAGYYNVSVWAETTEGNSSMLEFRTMVSRELASEHLIPFETTHYEEFQEAVMDLNTTGIMTSTTTVYTDVIGRLYYCVLFILPFIFMWVNNGGKLTIPVTLAMIVGATMIGFIPVQFTAFISAVIILAWASAFYKISRA